MDCTSDTKDELLAVIDIFGTVGGETTVVKSTISVLHIGYRQNVRVIYTVTINLVISIWTIWQNIQNYQHLGILSLLSHMKAAISLKEHMHY